MPVTGLRRSRRLSGDNDQELPPPQVEETEEPPVEETQITDEQQPQAAPAPDTVSSVAVLP